MKLGDFQSDIFAHLQVLMKRVYNRTNKQAAKNKVFYGDRKKIEFRLLEEVRTSTSVINGLYEEFV